MHFELSAGMVMMIYEYFAFAGESSLLTDGLTPADIKVHT